MRKGSLLFLLLACAALLTAAAPRSITVAVGETRRTPVNAFRASIDVRGKLDESLFLLGGRLRLEGEVTGDVICIAADVEIVAGGTIGRDLIVIGGSLRKADESRVLGQVYDVRSRKDMRQIAASVLPFLPDSGGMTFFKVIKTFFWLILALLALAVFPGAVAQAAAMLSHRMLRHAGRGLLAQLLFLLLTLVFLLLSFILIGIPLLVVLLAAFFLLLIFGRAAVFYFIGERLLRALKLRANAAIFIVLGVAIYTLLKFIPVVGWMILVILDFLAVGAAAGYLLKKKKATI